MHLSGGYGSGKSFSLAMKLFDLSWLNRPHPGGLMCPSFQDYKRDMLPAMEAILEKHRLIDHVKYNKSEFRWQFPWNPRPLYVVSAEKKLKGPNWAYAGVNELSLCPFERYRELMARVRVRNAKVPQIASVGTYEGIYPEYDDFFWDKANEKSRVIQASTRANQANLEDGYIEMLESAYDSRMVQAYIDGERVSLTGNAFYYGYRPDRNDRPNYPVPDREVLEYLITIDFNVDPMCAGVWIRTPKGGVVCIDQVKLEGMQGYDTRQLGQALIARGYTGSNSVLFPDPAGQARSTKGLPDVDQLKAMGFTDIRIKASAPRMRVRQLTANNLLEKGLVLIDPVKAPDMKKDLMKVTQDPVTLEKVKVNPKLTHFSDGMDYMLDILFPWSGRRAEIREHKIR